MFFIGLQTLIFIATANAAKIENFPLESQKFCKSRDNSCRRCSLKSAPITDSAFEISCHVYYEAQHCSEYKSSLPREQREDVISCDPETFCQGTVDWTETTCVIDGLKVQFTFSNLSIMAGGAVGAMLAGSSVLGTTVVALPFVIYGASKQAEYCKTDIEYKKMAILMHNLALLEKERKLDVKGQDSALLNLECADLNKFLSHRMDVLVGKRLDEAKWSLEPRAPQTPVGKALLDTLKSNKCLKENAIEKRFCQGISGFVAGMGLGMGVGRIATKATTAVAPKVPQVKVATDIPTTTPPTQVKAVTEKPPTAPTISKVETVARISSAKNIEKLALNNLQRVEQVEAVVDKASTTPMIGRTGTITKMMKDENIVPKNGVIHIVGASWTSAEEWAIPLLARNDTKLVLSQHGHLVKALSENLQNETMLRRVWERLNTNEVKTTLLGTPDKRIENYTMLVRESHIKSFEQFKEEIRKRITVNDGFETRTYQNVEGVIRPPNGSSEVPKADLMIMNHPMLDDAGVNSVNHMAHDKIFDLVKSQMKSDRSLLWVSTESLNSRLGSRMANQPMIEMPVKRTTFRNSGLLMKPGADSYDFTSNSYLIFFP